MGAKVTIEFWYVTKANNVYHYVTKAIREWDYVTNTKLKAKMSKNSEILEIFDELIFFREKLSENT